MKIIKERTPLILSITNYVAMNYTANALLAIGASPIMSSCQEEMEELAAAADSTVINIGCLDITQASAMMTAARTAAYFCKPWVLDPAGVGASRLRMRTVLDLLEYRPGILRGNAAEIMAIAGKRARSSGVDSGEDALAALDSAKELSGKYGIVVSVSGPVDVITDGERVETVGGGSPLMPRVTAMGCTATALSAAFCAVMEDPFEAAVEAMRTMARAGEIAGSGSGGPGSFSIKFLDALHTL